MERIAIDIAGPFPKTERDNKYILVIPDYFSKFVMAVPMKDQKAETVCDALMQNFFLYFGTPATLCSDQGANFESKLF